MEALRLEGVVPASRISVIYNGINGRNFPLRIRTRPTGGAPWRFLYVGQLIELKRVGLAISLVADLVSTGHNVTLDIVSQRETLREELEILARTLGLVDRVRFLGPRDRESLGHEMGDAHFLVLPSRTEALPTVVTEASHSGLPVIAFRVGGIAEQLPDGYALPEVDDYDGFAQHALDQMKGYESAVDVFAKHAEHVRIDFSPDAMVSQHLKLYTETYQETR
jgi:glycosyltransferase involved in cell wall biosynthesis